jgi:Arc/MetJ-type ribon-helix-helix transcriptional regulator
MDQGKGSNDGTLLLLPIKGRARIEQEARSGMVRVRVRLPEDQVERLRALAAGHGVSMSELIRRAVALFLDTEGHSSWEERKRRALEAVGRYASGESGVSADHDRCLEDAYAGSL